MGACHYLCDSFDLQWSLWLDILNTGTMNLQTMMKITQNYCLQQFCWIDFSRFRHIKLDAMFLVTLFIFLLWKNSGMPHTIKTNVFILSNFICLFHFSLLSFFCLNAGEVQSMSCHFSHCVGHKKDRFFLTKMLYCTWNPQWLSNSVFPVPTFSSFHSSLLWIQTHNDFSEWPTVSSCLVIIKYFGFLNAYISSWCYWSSF